jgi:hypothetical protein
MERGGGTVQRIMPWHLLTPGKYPEINVEDDTPILIAFLDWRAYERDGEVDEHGGYICRVSPGKVVYNYRPTPWQLRQPVPFYDFYDAQGQVQGLTYAWREIDLTPPPLPGDWRPWQDECKGEGKAGPGYG